MRSVTFSPGTPVSISPPQSQGHRRMARCTWSPIFFHETSRHHLVKGSWRLTPRRLCLPTWFHPCWCNWTPCLSRPMERSICRSCPSNPSKSLRSRRRLPPPATSRESFTELLRIFWVGDPSLETTTCFSPAVTPSSACSSSRACARLSESICRCTGSLNRLPFTVWPHGFSLNASTEILAALQPLHKVLNTEVAVKPRLRRPPTHARTHRHLELFPALTGVSGTKRFQAFATRRSPWRRRKRN